MPQHPQDDWSRAIPRRGSDDPTPEGAAEAAWEVDHSTPTRDAPADEQATQAMPQQHRNHVDDRAGHEQAADEQATQAMPQYRNSFDDHATQAIAQGSSGRRRPGSDEGFEQPDDQATQAMPHWQAQSAASAGEPVERRELVSRGHEYDHHERGRYGLDDQDLEEQRYRSPAQPGGPSQPPGPPTGPPPGPRPKRKRRRLRRVLLVLALLILGYLAAMTWAVVGSWNSVERVDATPTSDNRPADGSGRNYVLVGTDSRADLSDEERRDLVTGGTDGARADTLMVLHLPDSGEPTLISIPRDSYVEIPGYGLNKINTAYAFGGPALMVDTVEQSTGLRVDGYLEIGFGGFVNVVAEVGGVRMCLDEPVTDSKTRLDLPAGCQDLEGSDALNYVRMRYGDPRGDLGRVERQREFLAALVDEIATPGTVLNPFRLHSVGTATGSSLTIGEDTSLTDAARIAWGMRSVAGGSGNSVTVPIADPNYSTSVGSTVLWDEAAAAELFDALNSGSSLTIEP